MTSRLLHTLTFSFILVAFVGIFTPHASALICANGTPALLDSNDSEYCPPSTSTPSPAVQSTNPGPAVQSTNPGTTPSPSSGASCTGTNCLVNPLKSISSLPDLLKAVLAAAVQIGGIVLVLALVWVGFSYVRAQGKPEELKKAHSALLWTIIGGAILLVAQALSDVIQSTVNTL